MITNIYLRHNAIYFTPALHLFKISDIYLPQSKQLFTTVTTILHHPYIYSEPHPSIQHHPHSYLRQWHLSYATLRFIQNLRHIFNTIQTAIYDSDIYLTPLLDLFKTSDIYSTQSKRLLTTYLSYATLTFIPNPRHLFNTIQTAIYDSDIYLILRHPYIY